MKNEPYRLAKATAMQADTIRSLIRKVGINPMGLDWNRFILALDHQNRVIGCGQLKPHRDGCLELASLAVEPDWRGRGIAHSIIRELETLAPPGTLYLTCRSGLGPFYEKFGYSIAGQGEMPGYFRRINRIAGWITRLHLMNDSLLVMKKNL